MPPSSTAPPVTASSLRPADLAVVEDLRNSKTPLSASAIRRLPSLRTNGKDKDISWVTRMWINGAVGIDGHRHPLGRAKLPSGWVSTAEAVSRWLAELNGVTHSTPTARDLDQQHQQASRRLAAAGL